MTRRTPPTKLLFGVVTVMVLAAVVSGVWITGTPSQERSKARDRQRTNDLQQLADSIDTFYRYNAALPATLEELYQAPALRGNFMRPLTDPETKAPYEYSLRTATGYELCATFDLSSTDIDETRAIYKTEPVPPFGPSPKGPRAFEHEPGRQCFPLEATATVGQPCGQYVTCPDKQTCAVLRTGEGAVCVPTGKECAAAGCAPERCAISESYPVQVNCR